MKRIKRTITVRKIEFIGKSSHVHEANMEVCPLCKSPIHAFPPPNDSAVDHTTVESPIKLIGGKVEENAGEKDD